MNSLSPPPRIVIIGHGQAVLIRDYIRNSAARWPIYADPSKELYNKLGMIRTLQLGSKSPTYASGISTFRLALRSTWQELTAGRRIFKGGDYLQVGGDFVVEDGQVRWCHRMQNTRDHPDSAQIGRVLGLEGHAQMVTEWKGVQNVEPVVHPSKRWSNFAFPLKRPPSPRRSSWHGLHSGKA